MQNLLIKINNYNGEQVTSSRNIAENLGKRHSHVVESIEKLLSDRKILENQDIGSLIIPTFYKVEGQRRRYKEYLLTKDGFILYMFNIQGYNDLKLAYINEFNKMKKLLSTPQPQPTFTRLYWNNQVVMTVEMFSNLMNVSKIKINRILVKLGNN
ncbi:Rha family transcriptional regulator, partial [Gemella sp. 19428wG2_WT2a]